MNTLLDRIKDEACSWAAAEPPACPRTIVTKHLSFQCKEMQRSFVFSRKKKIVWLGGLGSFIKQGRVWELKGNCFSESILTLHHNLR